MIGPLGGRAQPAVLSGAAAAVGLFGLMFLAATAAIMFSSGSVAGSSAQPPFLQGASPRAEREIPPEYLRLYQAAGHRYGLDWAVLAGIGRVECDHGRDPDPSCTVEGAVNSAGAGGPMQSIATTWALYGVAAAGDGRADRWNASDAIFSAGELSALRGRARELLAGHLSRTTMPDGTSRRCWLGPRAIGQM